MKYLVTDPCYIIKGDEWDKLGNETGWGDSFVEALSRYSIKGVGKIIECDSTTYGDGCISVETATGKKYEIGVDAGLVCIAQVSNTHKPLGGFGALTPDLKEAVEFYEQAKKI